MDAIYRYDALGYKFTGKERDAESGLDNFGARYDASSMGRFMSADPVFISADRLTDPQSLNLYAYVRNDPLSLVDPTGLDFYLACQTSDHSGCGQVQNGSEKVWVQGQTSATYPSGWISLTVPNAARSGKTRSPSSVLRTLGALFSGLVDLEPRLTLRPTWGR